MIDKGDTAPSFELPGSGGDTIAVPTGNPTVLFFYPKDDTPGCTTESKGFSEKKDDFAKIGVNIIGMSPDPVTKHDKFAAKHGLTIPLASDEDKTTLGAYGVWVEKSMYGKTYMGVERSTFLLDKDGKIVEVWRKVRVKGHVDVVLEAATNHFGK